LLRDIERSTRGQMAGLQLDWITGPRPRLRVVGDRLALVRLGTRLAAAALLEWDELAVNVFGYVEGGEEAEHPMIEVLFTDPPLPEPVSPPSRRFGTWWWAFGWGVGAASLLWAVAWLLCQLLG
jgi:hypothetical protein